MSSGSTYSHRESTIAAIVCAHTMERWDDIEAAIASLHAQTRPADQVILSVDNNPQLFDAARATFDNIAVVHNTGRRGVSGARNVAAQATTCDILAYLDDDAVADTAWLEHLAGWYRDESVVGVGGSAHPAWDRSEPRWFPSSFNWVVGCSHSGIGDEPAVVRNFIGCNMSIRRTAWEAVGGFDEGIGRVGADGGGGDETDFCLRVSDTVGGVIMNDPRAIVAHRVPADRQTVGYFLKRCRSEGRSKAMISARAGSDQALSEERKHLVSELPRSFGRGLLDTARGDLAGAARSAAIVAGTAATGFGYVAGAVRPAKPAAPATPSVAPVIDDFAPTQVIVVDLAESDLPIVIVGDPAFVIVRRSRQLLATQRVHAAPTAAQLVADLHQAFPAQADLPRPPVTPATTAEKTVAIVIATRDRAEPLRRCLHSITKLHRAPDQIIVVDNAPTDEDTATLVSQWNETGDLPIHYVRCDQAGLANAHNAALAHLTTDLVAFTDDDVIVDPYWLDRLAAGFQVSDQVACVTGGIMPAELETWPQDWVESSSNFNKGFATRRFSASKPPADPLFPFTAGSMGSGANMAFTVEWLKANDGFDASLGVGAGALGGDDLRSFYDVIRSGHELVFTPDAIVFHHHHRTTEAIDRQAYGYGVGLTAYLTSIVIDEPAALLAMLRRAPTALRYAAKTTAPAEGHAYTGDKHRSRLQRRGMVAGPVRYVRTRSR